MLLVLLWLPSLLLPPLQLHILVLLLASGAHNSPKEPAALFPHSALTAGKNHRAARRPAIGDLCCCMLGCHC